MSLTPSEEQLQIVKSLKEYNVIVDSVAGSGKTTTIIFIAKEYPNRKILLLTYNNILAKETRARLVLEKIDNVDVYTYHAFAGSFYSRTCQNDSDMNRIIDERSYKDRVMYTEQERKRHELIVLDEVQDMTPTYFKFVVTHVRDYPAKRYCIIGDVYQNIYDFNGADSRFLSYADKLFNFNDRPFKKFRLSTSYRLTDEMATFINKVYLRTDRIKTQKPGSKVNYLVVNTFSIDKIFPKYIAPILQKYKPEDIFVLAPSIREKTPVKNLANYISEKEKLLLYVPNSDDEPFDEEAAKNKIAFSSFHQSKGRERKCVILFGIEATFVKFYCRGKIPNRCPNSVYVALTRAKEFMLVLHNSSYDFMSFCDPRRIKEYANCLVVGHVGDPKEVNPEPPKIPSSITNLLRHQPNELMDKLYESLGEVVTVEPGEIIVTPDKSYENGYAELVNDIIGLAIVLYYEYSINNHCSIMNCYDNPKLSPNLYYKINPQNKLETEIIRLAIHHNCVMSGYIHKKNQIKKLDFINRESFDKILARFKALGISKNARYEYQVSRTIQSTDIKGSIDCFDRENGIVWEFKFTKKLTQAHSLQLACYAAMLAGKEDISGFRFMLYNLKTGELRELPRSEKHIKNYTSVLNTLALQKLNVDCLPVDEAFLSLVKSIKNNVDIELDPDFEELNYLIQDDDTEPSDTENTDNLLAELMQELEL
jgi:hypothetical protein